MLPSTQEATRAASKDRLGRKVIASAAAASLVVGLAVALPKRGSASSELVTNNPSLPNQAPTYHLDQMYLDQGMIRRGFYFEGFNIGAPGYSEAKKANYRATLWYRDLGNIVLRYNTAPEDKNATCHYDKFELTSGDDGVIKYLSTYDGCDKRHANTIIFPQGIVFAPRTLSSEQLDELGWTFSGSSATIYEENIKGKQTPVCNGEDTYTSLVIGSESLADGSKVIQIQTNEVQKLEAIAGAPWSNTCPPGVKVEFPWQEDVKLAEKQAIVNGQGIVIGHAPGLVESWGGNPSAPGSSTAWDVEGVWKQYVKAPAKQGAKSAT